MLKTFLNLFVFFATITAFCVLAANAERFAVKDRIDFFGGDNVPLDPIGQIKKCKGMESWLKVTPKGNFEVIPPNANSPIEHQNAWQNQKDIWRTLDYSHQTE